MGEFTVANHPASQRDLRLGNFPFQMANEAGLRFHWEGWPLKQERGKGETIVASIPEGRQPCMKLASSPGTLASVLPEWLPLWGALEHFLVTTKGYDITIKASELIGATRDAEVVWQRILDYWCFWYWKNCKVWRLYRILLVNSKMRRGCVRAPFFQHLHGLDAL